MEEEKTLSSATDFGAIHYRLFRPLENQAPPDR
jgi:hypothetical protein